MAATYDVTVIGGGITGMSAALAARARGASTCLLRAAPGATAMMSGTWSGPLPDPIRRALADAGYPLEAAAQPIAHQRGDVVRADFAGQSHSAAVPASDSLVCGLAGLPHFNASALARSWLPGAVLPARTIELPGTPAAGWAVAALAAVIEQKPDVLLQALGSLSAPHVILPAVLGVARTPEIITMLQQRSGVTFSEALAVPPSLPGWRLQLAIDRVLAAHDIATFSGRALVESTHNDRVDTLRVGSDVVGGRAFVLATGKFVAGGLLTADSFQESVFDLPIWLQQMGDVYTAPDALPLTDPVRTEPQPLLQVGVQTDSSLRPIDRANGVIYRNVFAAGTIRAGWSAAGSGLGDCAADGWRAGELASA